MSRPIEEYALIGDLNSAALVGCNGSIDWLCLPRFDSQACFAALVGDERHGHWQIAPESETARVRRRYLPDTLVLETEFTTASGTVRLIDCMPPRDGDPMVLRMVEGVRGHVNMRMTLAAGFEYGSAQPRILQAGDSWCVVAGSEALWLFSPVHMAQGQGVGFATFSVRQGDRVPFAIIWRPSHAGPPTPPLVPALVERAAQWWREWVAGLRYEGEWRDAVIRSLITLKALTYAPTGGVIAAPTTSLPQQASGIRNWDYRYCWLSDAAEAVTALIHAGTVGDATAVLNWMIQAVSGSPAAVQSLYGVAGEQRLPELELDWLPGYEGARPVRIGNAAASQFQLAVFGDVQSARLQARMAGISSVSQPWEPDAILGFLESKWREPDTGIYGAGCAVRSRPTCSNMAMTPAAPPSCSVIRQLTSTRTCCGCRSPGSCPPSTSGLPAPWTRSSGSLATAACCFVTERTCWAGSMGSRRARVPTCRAPSGWPSAWPGWGG